MRTALLTLVALVAFAANSILCRLALGTAAIDAASFTTLRIVSGAVTLLVVVRIARPGGSGRGGDWASAVALFLYAIAFSFAYLRLSAGTGALILFGAVQLTMILAGLRSGERPPALEWAGIVLALGGLVYLVLPGLAAPSPIGAALMASAGVAWGVYSLFGRTRGRHDPMLATTANFTRAVPLALAVSLVRIGRVEATGRGVVLAVVSGAVTSGLGYVVWYAALRGLTATRAAAVQLAVPVIAAAGGAAFLAERVSSRLVVAAVAILGGIAAAIRVKRKGDRHRFP